MFERTVLDKGYVKLLNISGAIPRDPWDSNTDSRIRYFNADDTDPALVARTSFANGLREHPKEQDEALVEYLIRNSHTSPLEFTTVYLEFKMPLFVARQFMRHRTASINEVSGRYVTLPNDWYIPEVVRGKHSGGNKQGSEDNLDLTTQETFKEQLEEHCEQSYWWYKQSLEDGVCPEQARMFLHLNHYTSFVWKQDLHNLMHLLSLRLDEHAQWEARQYAEAIYSLLKEYLPKSMEWFDTYRRKFDSEELTLLTELVTRLAKEPEVVKSYYPLLKKLAKRQGIKL